MSENKGTAMTAKDFGLFATIPLLAFIVVLIIPFIAGLVLTFTDWNGFDMSGFVGWANYQAAFSDKRFGELLLITFKYVFWVLLFTNIVAFGLALIITSNIRGRGAFRSAFFLPNLLGGILLGLIWQFVFNRVLVAFGKTLGIPFLSGSWLSDPNMALWSLIIVTVWQQSGYMMLIYIAGIMNIDSEIMEAAAMDGAGPFRKTIDILIPSMMQSFTICLFLTLKNAFMSFDINLALTNGGPFRSTELLTLNIYNEAFTYQNYGTAQAKAIVLFVIVLVISVLQVYLTRRKE